MRYAKHSQLTPPSHFLRLDELSKVWKSPFSHAKNQHYTSDAGIDGSAELSGGAALLAGVYIDGAITGKVEVEHHLLQEGDGSSETTVSIELGDCKLA